MQETARSPPPDGTRQARSRVSAGSPTRPTLGAASAASWRPGGAVSAPTTPMGRSKPSFRMRVPTDRFSSNARSTRRVVPPRRMSTRLQFTLRERLHSRRLSAQLTPDEAAGENSDDDEDAEDDEEEEEGESDSDSESDGSSDKQTSDTAPVGESSSPTAAAAVDADGPTRSKAGMSMRRRRERKRRRRRRRWIRTVLSALVAFYYLFSLPLRFGLYFDPFFTAPHAKQWTHSLTVFLSLDVVADICNLVLRLWTRRRETRREQRRLAAQQLELQVDGAHHVEDDDSTPEKSRRLQWSDALDVVACFPIEILLLATTQYNALHIARLTKIFTLWSLPSVVRDFTLTRRGGRSLFASGVFHRVLTRFLTVLMVIGIVWVHWSALIFILIAHVECGLDLTRTNDCAAWAIDDQLRDVAAGGGGGSKWRLYSRAVYWASRTIITLGFSDVIPNSSRPMETFFAVIGEFAGAFWCAGVIAGFAYWFTLQHRQGSKNSHDMFVHRVEHLLGRAHFGHTSTQDETALGGSVVPDFLRRRIVEYLHHEWNASRVFGEPQFRAIVRQEQLRQGLTCELKTTKLLRLQCFSRQSLGFLNAMAGEMKLMSLAPLDWVIEYPGTQSLFFVVMTGTIAVVSPSDEGGQKIHTCGAGDCFGAITLFDASALKEKAFAEEYAEILMLDADGLERVLSTYYHDRASTANEQRDEMYKAAQEDYTAFTERCKRKQELRAVMEPQDDPSATHTVPHWDALQTEMECAPRIWYNPQSLFRANWEAVRCLALLYLTFEVPYNVIFYYGGTYWSSFGPDGNWKFASTFAISAVVELFFYIDLYLRCRAFQPRKSTNSRTFYLDAIANLPLALVVDIYDGCTRGPLPHGWKWLSLLRLVRLLRVRRLKKRVEATLPRVNGVAQFIIYSAISILVYCHVVACMWFLAGHYSLPSSTFTPPTTLPSKPECLRMAQEYGNCTWTVMDNMETIYDSGDHRFVYLRSMYFSISTFTTVAYGDILPYNILETWIAALATYVGGVLCYVMFGAMGAALARLARRRRETRYENHLRARVMEMHGVSRHVRSEINRFQTFRAKILAEHELEQEVLSYITPGLRGELNKCIHRAEARRFAFMHRAAPAFCDAVAAVMTRRFYFAGDMMFTAGEPAKEAMVICRGRVQLVDGESQLKVAVLADGATLAERSFMAQTESMLVDYVAETVTEVSVLSRDALVTLWNHYPSEMRRMLNDDDDASDHPQEHKYVPMSSTSVFDATHALSRILIRRDSRGQLGGADFEKQIKWQRAINGNTFRSRWEVVVGGVVIYNTFSILARVVFAPSPSTDAMITLTVVDYIFDLVLLVDIYLKSFHFLAPGDLLSVSTRIFAPQQIRQYYYREGWMVFDMVASMPLYYIGSNYALMTYFRLPRVLRALQLVEIGERIHAGLLHRWTASTSSAGVAYSLLGLSKVMMVLALCCHIGGSIFYAVSTHESKDSGRTPWVLGDVVILQHVGDAGVAYLRSFYWAISTVTVVNYGDIVATTVRETAWACVICLVGTFFMSKVVSDLVDLLQSLDQCASEHRDRVEQFEYVAQRRELPDDLTERGQVFLNYSYEVTHGLPPPEELFSSLPSQLQAQVYNEMYGSILRRVPLFESLSDAQIQELAAAPWRTELFLPDDMIVYENSLADALFVMRHGRAEVLRFASGLSITQIESGQLFGEAMFFTADEGSNEKGGPRRMVSIRALSFCEVLRLDREAWLRFLAMRASNRAAGRRVLELAQGEQLKSRAVLQKLESNLLSDRDGAEDVSGDRSSMSSDEQRDGFVAAAPEASKNLQFGQRNLRMASAPPAGPPQAAPSSSGMRRFGSTPALFLSQMARHLSFTSNNNTRRPSDAYAALATPDTTRPVIPPSDVAARRAKSNMNVLRHFESSPMTPEAQESEQQHANHEPSAMAPLPRFVDSSRFCYRWDAVKFFAILYYVAALPLRVSFYDDIQRAAQLDTGNGDRVMRTWIVCEYVFIDGFLWLDIFMRLFVFVPTVRGEPLTSPTERRRWYMRHGSFVIDVMGSFPLEVLALLPIHAFRDGTERRSIVAAAFRLTTLVRCFQLEPLWWRLERQLFWFQKDTLAILKIVFVGVLSSHWLACLWYFVGNATTGISPLSWLTAPNMLAPLPADAGNATALTVADVQAVSLLNKYLRSYHYAIGSISTTTYGDIVSRNVAETIVQLVVTFLCIVFYGYVTTGVRQILSRKFARTIALEQDEAKIQRFARHYALSRSLTTAIRSHLRERWRQESDVDQNAVAHLLHGPLRREISAYLRSPLFETVEPRRLAFDGLPEVVVTAMLAELHEEAYVEGEVIYEQFAVGDVMYFVESGTVQLTTQQRDHARITSLQQQGEYFGESCVVDRAACGSERRETAVAHTACRLVVLHVDAFERVLALYPTYAATIRAAWTSQTTFAV